ncbi:hypothetical protein KM043_018354 [Ampulex compressa]|nr:hypothetical protein KM043_018354 [Ampulex compressa]
MEERRLSRQSFYYPLQLFRRADFRGRSPDYARSKRQEHGDVLDSDLTLLFGATLSRLRHQARDPPSVAIVARHPVDYKNTIGREGSSRALIRFPCSTRSPRRATGKGGEVGRDKILSGNSPVAGAPINIAINKVARVAPLAPRPPPCYDELMEIDDRRCALENASLIASLTERF